MGNYLPPYSPRLDTLAPFPLENTWNVDIEGSPKIVIPLHQFKIRLLCNGNTLDLVINKNILGVINSIGTFTELASYCNKCQSFYIQESETCTNCVTKKTGREYADDIIMIIQTSNGMQIKNEKGLLAKWTVIQFNCSESAIELEHDDGTLNILITCIDGIFDIVTQFSSFDGYLI